MEKDEIDKKENQKDLNLANLDMNNLTDEDARKILLFFCLMIQREENEKIWDDYAKNLIYKNRFTSDSKVCAVIEKYKEPAALEYKKERILYRARVVEKEPVEMMFYRYYQDQQSSEQEINSILGHSHDMSILLENIFPANLFSGSDENKYVTDFPKVMSWWEKEKFQGYNSKDSSIPPAEKINDGRANPRYICYLYLSEDEETPVYEVRPMNSAIVSVAKFKLKKNLKLYDFTKSYQIEHDNCSNTENSDVDVSLFQVIGDKFSVPQKGGWEEYLPTQFIVEKIKNMGFDGIRFKSSLKNEGVNIVLFNPENCEAVSSKLVRVQNNELKIEATNV